MDEINMYSNLILTGVWDFFTDLYMYDYEGLADNVNIIMEDRVGEATTPMRWTYMYKGGRIFRLVPGSVELFHDLDYDGLALHGRARKDCRGSSLYSRVGLARAGRNRDQRKEVEIERMGRGQRAI